jgi:insulysin
MIEFYTTYIIPTSLKRAKLVVQLRAQKVSPKSSDATERKDEEVVGDDAVPTNGIEASIITDVRDFKSGLVASAGARPVRDLCEFEDVDPKL